MIAALAALAILSVVQGCQNAAQYSQDFQWDAAKVLMQGFNPYDESLHPSDAMLSLGYEEYYKQMEANQFPSLLMLLFPYTLLPPLAARYAWIVSNLIFTALMCLMLRKTFFSGLSNRMQITLYLLMLAGTPWRNQIGVGQHTIFSFLFFLLGVYLSERKKPVLSALCLFVGWFKYTLTVPLALYLVYKRRWKELILSVIPHVILTAVAAFMVHDSVINMILKPLKVASVLSGEGSMDIGALLGGGSFAMLLTVVLLAGLFAAVCFMPEGHDLTVITCLLLWSLIITYHRSYDYFVLILPFAWLVSMYERKERTAVYWCGCYILLILAVFFGLRIFHESPASLLAVGACYYIYTGAVTLVTVRTILSRGKSNG